MRCIRCPRYSTWNKTNRLIWSLNAVPDFSITEATIFPLIRNRPGRGNRPR